MRNAVCTSSRLSTHDFCRGGQLLLWASRHWMRAFRQNRIISPCVWQSFALARLQRAYPDLCQILAVLAFREFPAGNFAAPNQPSLRTDEAEFMKLFSAIEIADIQQATETMHGRASPAVTRAVLRRCARVIIELHRQGQRIECRNASREPYSLRTHEAASRANTIH